jgi:hypothetical protein
MSELCDGLRKKNVKKNLRFFTWFGCALMMMIGESISQFCSCNSCPFYKSHESIHVLSPSTSKVKYVLHIVAWFLFYMTK